MTTRQSVRLWHAAAVAGLLPALSGPSAVAVADTSSLELTIEIRGIGELAGTVAIAVFDSAAAYESRKAPIARASLPADGERVVWKTTVPADRAPLAVMAYHDLNANGRIDFGRFGIPQEPYGFSNDARAVFGPPEFAQASFVPEARTRLAITLR